MSSTWVLAVALLGIILSLLALFFVWRQLGSSLSADGLPKNVQTVITQLREEYEEQITYLHKDYENKMAVMRTAYDSDIARLTWQVEWLLAQLLAAGGKQVPTMTSQMDAKTTDSQRREMLVAVVDDPGLQMDLAIFRRARIPFIRLKPVTLSGFEVAINRARREGKPFRYIHLAAHTNADGADFSGEKAIPEWLSERMRGVEILLIAGCESSEIGDWLAGIADYVVTMAEPVSAGTRPALSDIGIFAEVFWSAVYDGKTATDAFYTAIERSPTWIGEIAEIHAGIRAT